MELFPVFFKRARINGPTAGSICVVEPSPRSQLRDGSVISAGASSGFALTGFGGMFEVGTISVIGANRNVVPAIVKIDVWIRSASYRQSSKALASSERLTGNPSIADLGPRRFCLACFGGPSTSTQIYKAEGLK